MIVFIMFLLPSIFGIKIFLHLNSNDKSWDTIINYFCLVLFSNYICISIVALINNLDMNLIEYAKDNYIFCIKYISLMIITNLILAMIFTVIKKYVSFSIEVENGQKNKQIKKK